MTLAVELIGDVRVISLDCPPVNAFGLALRTALYAALQPPHPSSVKAIILRGSGRCFSAGGDIRELGTPAAQSGPGLSSHVQAAIESSPVPIIALLHGLAIGGGLETALACHYRVARADTRLALPEVSLGLIPLSGSQRLPRVLGLERATSFILSAERCPAATFRHTALFDLLIDDPAEDVLTAALAFASSLPAQGSHRLIRDRAVPGRDATAALRRLADATPREQVAKHAAIGALLACAEEPGFDQGMQRARIIYDQLASGPALAEARAAFLGGQRTAS
jgi:enoyl-CoA hydratase